MSKIKKFIFAVFVVLVPVQVLADPSNILPNPAEIGNSEIYLEIAQKKTDPGVSGINLQAPDSFQKVIYVNPASVSSLSLGVYGGCWSDTGGIDSFSPSGCPGGAANNTTFRIYSSNANGTAKMTCSTDKDGQTMSPNGWNDYTISFTGGCAPAINTEHSRPGSPAYVLYVRAFFDTGTPVSTGRINAFKLRSSNGKLTFMDQDDFDYFKDNAAIALDTYFSVQRRTGTNPTGSDGTVGDDFRFEFGTVCSKVDDLYYNTQDVPRNLSWSDADHSGVSNSNPPNDNIRWKLFEKPVGAASFPASPIIQRSTPAEMGGNNEPRDVGYAFKPLHEYVWRWENVIKNNGVQFRTPFDGFTQVQPCPAQINVTKALLAGGAAPAVVANANVRLNQSSVNQNSTANPARFGSLRGGTVAEVFAGAAAGYVIEGYRFCDQTAVKNCNPAGNNPATGTPYPLVKASSKVFNTPVAGHRYAMVFYYKPGTSSADCVSIVANPTTATPNQTINVDMSFRNTSTNTWSTAGGYNARKGTAAAGDPPVIGPNNVSFPASPSSYPGTQVNPFPAGGTSTVVFDRFSIAAPNTPGTYTITYNIALNGTAIEQPCTVQITVGAPKIKHKIYAINYLDILKSYVRDNESFGFDILTYIFPGAGPRNSDNLWQSGIYDNQGGNSDNARDARLDAINSINNVAEYGCVEGRYTTNDCKARTPLAYVPQNDGSGIAGSTTPNGNIWLSLRNTQVGGANALRGGIASTDTTNVGGYSGVHLENVEVSNIRVAANGITTTANQGDRHTEYQGKVDDASLQTDARGVLNLPTGSQNSQYRGWDNVRNPNIANSGYFANITTPNIEFTNTSGSPLNFNVDFNNLLPLINSAPNRQYAAGQATSYLQDGNADSSPRPYANSNEPLTLSQGVATVSQTLLRWDEYVDWTQVDDKGHYRPISSYGVTTGFELGAYTSPHYETLHYYSGGNYGSPVYQYTIYYYYCYNAVDGTYTYGSSTSGTPAGCTTYYQYDVYDYSTSCQSTGPTYAYNTYAGAGWSTPNNRTQFGWINTQATQSGGLPKGSNGQTTTSYFTAGNGASNPGWSNTNNTAFWQDTNITGMPNSGSTAKPAHNNRWIYDTSDPLYSNRMIYDGYNYTSYSNGYVVGGTTYTCWYSASGSGGYPATDVSYQSYVDGYYANPRYLYENSSTPTTPYYGLYGNPATFDGSSDGAVDTGFAWVSNKQRVRYEYTWNGRSRDLGGRAISNFGGSDANDSLLYSIDNNGTSAQPARGSAIIYNPTIQASNGDIYSGRNIDSYFSGSGLSSAFLYAGGNILGFSSSNNAGGLNFPGYFPNPTKSDGSPSGNRTIIPGSGLDAIHSVFRDFDSTFSAANLSSGGNIGGTISGGFNLGSNAKRVYKTTGNLTINGATFCGGAGSIYVPGNLIINGNIDYCGYSGAKSGLPSVGFIVGGQIIVSPSVDGIAGTYFAQREFFSGTVVTTTNRTSSDKPFTLNGLIIADSFKLQRQLGSDRFNQFGGVNAAENTPERFNYDGRIVVSPPPGFTDLYNAGATWNETVPYN